jgi:hypothetical protein
LLQYNFRADEEYETELNFKAHAKKIFFSAVLTEKFLFSCFKHSVKTHANTPKKENPHNSFICSALFSHTSNHL